MEIIIIIMVNTWYLSVVVCVYNYKGNYSNKLYLTCIKITDIGYILQLKYITMCAYFNPIGNIIPFEFAFNQTVKYDEIIPFEHEFKHIFNSNEPIVYPNFVTNRLNFFTQSQRDSIILAGSKLIDHQRQVEVTLTGSTINVPLDLGTYINRWLPVNIYYKDLVGTLKLHVKVTINNDDTSYNDMIFTCQRRKDINNNMLVDGECCILNSIHRHGVYSKHDKHIFYVNSQFQGVTETYDIGTTGKQHSYVTYVRDSNEKIIKYQEINIVNNYTLTASLNDNGTYDATVNRNGIVVKTIINSSFDQLEKYKYKE